MYSLRKDDDDWGQTRTLVRDVMDDAACKRLVSNIVLIKSLVTKLNKKLILKFGAGLKIIIKP